jgi:hypothetical protein
MVDSFQDDSPGYMYTGDQYLLYNNYQHDLHPSPYCCEESFLKWDHHPHYPLPTRGPWLAPVFVPCTADIFFVRAVAGYLLQLQGFGFANEKNKMSSNNERDSSCRHGVFIFCEQRQLPSKNFLGFQ